MAISSNHMSNHMFVEVLGKWESVLWQGKPDFFVYISKSLIIFWCIALRLPFFSIFAQNNRWQTVETNALIFSLIFLSTLVITAIRPFLTYSNTYYAFTDKRVVKRTWFFGTDFSSVEYDKISDAMVTVNWLENILHKWSIKIISAWTNFWWQEYSISAWNKSMNNTGIVWIENPYEVYKQLKELMTDIKTDIHYPNALRPENNPWYKTAYKW